MRLRHGDFTQARCSVTTRCAVALQWQELGAEALHVVDLDAARSGDSSTSTSSPHREKLPHPVEYGGGVRTPKSLAMVAGTKMRWMVMGTAAITEETCSSRPSNWLGDRLVVGVDCDRAW